MREVVYSVAGDSSVLHELSAPDPEPGTGEVRVRIAYSGVNPTDWKSRRGLSGSITADQIPNQDGSGVIDAVGDGVPEARIGERVWLWESAYGRRWGTAAESVLALADHAVPLPDGAALDAGASLGVPVMTAHRALTAGANVPDRLSAGSLSGRTVLVAGGAGAVGHAAIQLARWAGATVITTISNTAKGRLASAAGAQHVIDYTRGDTAASVLAVAPDGVDVIVEVNAVVNAELDTAVIAQHGTVSVYAGTAEDRFTLPVRAWMAKNARWQFVLIYSEPTEAKAHAVEDISAALQDGALPVGEDAGLPLLVLPLARTAAAHDAVEDGFVGKVLIEVDPGNADEDGA